MLFGFFVTKKLKLQKLKVRQTMIFTTSDGKSFDTQNDLTPPERHVLQKLFLWETMASDIEQFREKKAQALAAGWNNCGPVQESEAMKDIIQELENRIVKRSSEV
jgi:hypothetical protein